MVSIKAFGYLGCFSFIVNNLLINRTQRINIFDGLITSFGSRFITNDNFFGLCLDILIRFIFSFNINEMSDFLRMFGIR